MQAEALSDGEPVNILLVDDQPAKLLSYELILKELGQNLIKASSGREALEALLKNDVAVILIDVVMPDLDGFELARMIREHPRFKDTAIIFVSAINVSDIDTLRGYELGAVDYVPVPVVPGLLRAKVRVFVELHQKTRSLAQINDELEARVVERTKELEAAIERQGLLSREVDHRARNSLAVIQSIVSLTQAPTASEFAAAIKGRIKAMAHAHTLLSDTRWRGADLLRLVEEELAPYRGPGRVRIGGHAVDIVPTVAQTLALAIHELATNAAKYGALSGEDGRLDVRWAFEGEHLVLNWTERTALPTTAPNRTGFGSRLIKSSIEGQLKGALASEWRADGLSIIMRIPKTHFIRETDQCVDSIETEKPAESVRALVSRRILVVEDEPLVSMMMKQALTELNAVVVGPYGSIAEAAAGIEDKLDAALLDINVGDELVYPVAESLLARGVPIIFVTGYQAGAIDARFEAAPILTKPVTREELAMVLSRVLSQQLACAT